MTGRGTVWLALAAVALVTGCKREERSFRVSTPSATRFAGGVQMSELEPGPATPRPKRRNDYESNAQAMTEGQMLYNAFNCVGCHAHGGGGIGPPLMDEKWRYGSEPMQVMASILEGRPNGMPAFRGKLSEHQVAQIAAYVRSLSGLVPIDAANARPDHMKGNPPPNSVDPVKPQREKAP